MAVTRFDTYTDNKRVKFIALFMTDDTVPHQIGAVCTGSTPPMRDVRARVGYMGTRFEQAGRMLEEMDFI